MESSIQKFIRILDVAVGVHGDRDVHPSVKRMYEEQLVTPATMFLTENRSVTEAATKANVARIFAKNAIKAVDMQYRVARSVVAGRLPGQLVPGTLKEQPTDTDRKLVLKELFDAVEAHRGEAWADEILAGPFGTLVPDAIAKIVAYLAAGSELATAVGRRGAAMEEAYAVFLTFKDAVRQAHGKGSDLYRRLRLRTRGAAAAEPTPETPVVSTTPTVSSSEPAALAAPSNGSAH